MIMTERKKRKLNNPKIIAAVLTIVAFMTSNFGTIFLVNYLGNIFICPLLAVSPTRVDVTLCMVADTVALKLFMWIIRTTPGILFGTGINIGIWTGVYKVKNMFRATRIEAKE